MSDNSGVWVQHIQGSHFFGDMKFHVFTRLFPGQSNEIQGQFGSTSQYLCLIMYIYGKDVVNDYFCK